MNEKTVYNNIKSALIKVYKERLRCTCATNFVTLTLMAVNYTMQGRDLQLGNDVFLRWSKGSNARY